MMKLHLGLRPSRIKCHEKASWPCEPDPLIHSTIASLLHPAHTCNFVWLGGEAGGGGCSSLVAQITKNLSAVQETLIQPLGGEDSLRKEWLHILAFLPGEFHGQKSLATVHGVRKSQT